MEGKVMRKALQAFLALFGIPVMLLAFAAGCENQGHKYNEGYNVQQQPTQQRTVAPCSSCAAKRAKAAAEAGAAGQPGMD
jgi:hypothetical protein